jgi:hypothetical protein
VGVLAGLVQIVAGGPNRRRDGMAEPAYATG